MMIANYCKKMELTLAYLQWFLQHQCCAHNLSPDVRSIILQIKYTGGRETNKHLYSVMYNFRCGEAFQAEGGIGAEIAIMDGSISEYAFW